MVETDLKSNYSELINQLQFKGPKVFVFMNGWFMEKPSNWPPS